jgi:hypothetical protein
MSISKETHLPDSSIPNISGSQAGGIALCLGPSVVKLTFPLNAAERQKLSFAVVADQEAAKVS